MRREFAALASSSAQLLPPTHHQDQVYIAHMFGRCDCQDTVCSLQWTRRAVLSQLNQHSMDTASHPHSPPSPTSSSPPLTMTHHNPSLTHHDSSTEDDDSAVFLAATQLLELSKTQPLNGVVNTLQMCKQNRESLDLSSSHQSSGKCVSNCDGEVLDKTCGDKSGVVRTDVHANMEEREGEKGREGETVNGLDDVVMEEERDVGNKGSGEVKECAMEVGGGGMENGDVVSGDSVMSENAEREKGQLCCNENKEEIKMEEGTSEDVKTPRAPTFGR